MTSRRFVSLAVAAAILAAALPAAADPVAGSEARLRASIDRAMTAPAPATPAGSSVKASKAPRRSQSGGTSNGVGGGGGGHMILALLGTAISVGATIYVVKQMQKNQEPPTSFAR